ncbi:sugar diacid recognition domain-containing protein [Halopseudomonas pachastrellae]|nr:sugar diacid recognition domain-containing protein [Halopseudomonas pachastrellae]
MKALSWCSPTSALCAGRAGCGLLAGVKPGINLPLLHAGRLVGVLGITGDPEQVRPFAELLRMTAEMLVEQRVLQAAALARAAAGSLAGQPAGARLPAGESGGRRRAPAHALEVAAARLSAVSGERNRPRVGPGPADQPDAPAPSA